MFLRLILIYCILRFVNYLLYNLQIIARPRRRRGANVYCRKANSLFPNISDFFSTKIIPNSQYFPQPYNYGMNYPRSGPC
jgi:hypothetical protein